MTGVGRGGGVRSLRPSCFPAIRDPTMCLVLVDAVTGCHVEEEKQGQMRNRMFRCVVAEGL